MNNSRTVQLLITVIFLGIILSCTVFFGITALISSSDSYVDTPYRADAPLPDTLNRFDRGVFLDKQLRQVMIELDYRVFSQIASEDVLAGQEDFLFPLSAAGYDYLSDFTGDAPYDEQELDRLAKSIEKRRIAYANSGAEYLLAVIPNSQTLYGEFLPGNMARADGESRLEQLSAYLARTGETAFLDLTDALLDGKDSGLLYNNTENSINALGANAIYRAVLSALSGLTEREFTPFAREEINIFTRYTDGKALARLADVSDIVRNRTLSLDNNTKLKYQIFERIAGMEITYTTIEYKNEIPNRPAILLAFSDEWDKIQLMPYFSNTFGTAAYKTNPAFSLYAVDYVKPNLVVEFVHEYELDSLVDQQVMLSYNDGLKEGEDPFVAAAPVVLGIAQNAEDSICIVGSCEDGAEILLSGEGIVVARTAAREGRFIIEAKLETAEPVTASLIARVEGKEQSGETALELKLSPFAGKPSVAVGSNSMLFRAPALTATQPERYSQVQLYRISSRYMRLADEIRILTGKNTETVYVYIPDKATIYRDALASAEESSDKRLTQLSEALANAPRVNVFDLTETLPFVRPVDRLYLQTGSTLSPFGALSVCRLVMSGLAEKDTRITPVTYQDYQFNNTAVPGGDLLALLGLDPASITEQIITLTPQKARVSRTGWNGESGAEQTEAVLYTNTDQSLPVALVSRDLYGTELLPYLAEHFSRMYVLAEGDFTFTEVHYETIKPDYVFTLSHEYHLPLN